MHSPVRCPTLLLQFILSRSSGKCRQTLRGHVDSVNAVAWQPYSSNVCSASGDKTVSVWDARTGLCVQTLYGHSNSVNNLVVSNRGDMIVSSDADGVVKVWDVRMVAELGTIDAGQHPINKVGKMRTHPSIAPKYNFSDILIEG